MAASELKSRRLVEGCYHIILTSNLRRTWQALDPAVRPANWLALYKCAPATLKQGLPDLNRFDALLATIPVTVAGQQSQGSARKVSALDKRLRYFMARYHHLPQDALIRAVAERLDVTAIVTLDRDWRRVTQFDIYTVPN